MPQIAKLTKERLSTIEGRIYRACVSYATSSPSQPVSMTGAILTKVGRAPHYIGDAH